ncbi:MAG: relaxase/mobilization nuclease domain-containing protein [Rhodomicrobium sp.]|nr:relaxase/mobilization nuclease domain-containing protein [Rhodomicrobium sp.]
MIAKRILRPKAASDFARLGAYILRDGRTKGEAGAGRIFGYILNEGESAERVGAVRVTNCLMESPDLAIKEILATQALNKRSRGDRTYHLVVSFEPGEKPEPAAYTGPARRYRNRALRRDRAQASSAHFRPAHGPGASSPSHRHQQGRTRQLPLH